MCRHNMKYLALALGFIIGNFSYQYFNNVNYEIAIERTFFQYAALLSVFIVRKL